MEGLIAGCGVEGRETMSARTVIQELAISLMLVLSGCAYQSLVPEKQLTEFARLGSAADGVPLRTSRIAMPGTSAKEMCVAVHESGTGQRPRTLVMIHGVLSDSRMWRYMRGELGNEHDLLMIDLPGCGQSDCPSTADLPTGGFSPAGLARTVLLALRQKLADRPRSEHNTS